MKANEGGMDRAIRVVLGIVLLIAGIYEAGSSTVIGAILIIVGAIVLITGITGFCALYKVLGISTCKTCEK